LSNQTRILNWQYHFAGVVAESGRDRVVLENYARADKRGGGPDPRWFFQMYGERSGQSFHEVHAGTEGFANPVTVVVAAPNVGSYLETRLTPSNKTAHDVVIFALRHDPKYTEIYVHRDVNGKVVKISKGSVEGPVVVKNSQLWNVAIAEAARR
jgi:hypothetical protein